MMEREVPTDTTVVLGHWIAWHAEWSCPLITEPFRTLIWEGLCL